MKVKNSAANSKPHSPGRRTKGKHSVSSWNKGLSPSVEQVEKMRSSLVGKSWNASDASRESKRLKMTEIMRKHGGYRPGSGRGQKTLWVDRLGRRVHFDSSYELRFAKLLDKHKVTWSRNIDRFAYAIDATHHSYTPDFVVEGRYVEVKGFERPEDKYKWLVVPGLIVVREHDLKLLEVSTYDSVLRFLS